MSGPKRIQRRRTKGWRMPEGAIYVGRPSRWGNPYRVGEIVVQPYSSITPFADWRAGCFAPARSSLPRTEDRVALDGSAYQRRWFVVQDAAMAVCLFRELSEFECWDLSSLRGHDLVCWCPLDQPCHADVLLDLANLAATGIDTRTGERRVGPGTHPGSAPQP